MDETSGCTDPWTEGLDRGQVGLELALMLRKQGDRPLMVAADPYRPAAVTQIQTLGRQLDLPVYHEPDRKPPDLAQVKESDIDALFAPLGDDEWHP